MPLPSSYYRIVVMEVPKQKTNVPRQLFQLQALDLEIEAARESLRQITSQLGESQALVSARADLGAQKQRLDDLSREQQALEWDIDDQTGKITALEEKLYGGKVANPKELTSLQQDVEALKRRRRQVEDRALEIMERREQAAATVASRADELAKLEKSWRAEQQKLEREAEALAIQLRSLERRFEEFWRDLDAGLTSLYEKLKRQKGNAVASVEQGICHGCRISLSQAQLQQVRTGSLIQCGNCGRVLYLA